MPLYGQYQLIQSPTANVLAGTTAFPTVQSAVTYAETLAASDSAPGVAVFVPAGSFAEAVTIHKNVSIIGAGVGLTSITSIEFDPSSTSVGTAYSLVKDLSLTSYLKGHGRVGGGGSTTYNINEFITGLVCMNVNADSLDLSYTNRITMYDCNITGASPSSLDTNWEATFYTCTINNCAQHVSDAIGTIKLPFEMQQLGQEFSVITFYGSSVSTFDCNLGTPLTLGQELDLQQSAFGLVTLNDDTRVFLNNAYLGVVTQAGVNTNIFVNTLLAYAPAAPSDWSPAPADIVAAIDQLAARVKALEP